VSTVHSHLMKSAALVVFDGEDSADNIYLSARQHSALSVQGVTIGVRPS
jgi:hypothetical protein